MSVPSAPPLSSARRRLAWTGVVVLALALALAPGALAPASLRALAAAAAIGAAALLARGRLCVPAPPPRLAIVSRQPLSRDTGVALVEVDGRALLVGFGAAGVRLLDRPPGPAPADELHPGAAPIARQVSCLEARA